MKRYIRANAEKCENEYHEFVTRFSCGTERTLLRIGSETDYCVYVNGRQAGYGQFGDLIDYRVYDELDITPFLTEGENILAVRAYFEHKHNAHYMEKGTALAFEIVCGEQVVCESDGRVLSRPSRAYRSGTGVPLITRQLGYGYEYDFRGEDGWERGETLAGFAPSVELKGEVVWHKRPIQKLVERKLAAKIVRSGSYGKISHCATAAERMYRAPLRERAENAPLPDRAGFALSGEDDLYLLVDLCDEVAGILTFDIEVEAPCDLSVAYGEHIADGRIRSFFNNQSFAFEFHLQAGRNRFTGHFRRLGARYLSLLLGCNRAKIYDLNVIATEYPVREREASFSDGRLREIYRTAVKTLKVCMHEHYEDTPWREQGLYAMDARNEMLCSAYAFEDWQPFARASLQLMSHNLRPDGVFTITTPATRAVDEINIPSFSLIQFCLMEDYTRLSGDASLFAEYEQNYRTVFQTFLSRMEKNGCIKPFREKQYWNFYDWTDELDSCKYFGTGKLPDRYEAPLVAFFAMAARSFISLLKGISHYRGEYDEAYGRAVEAVGLFFDEKKNCFADFMDRDGRLEHYSELTNSLCALVSRDPRRVSAALSVLTAPSDLSPITLSHSIFKFEALLAAGEAYRGYVLEEIKRIWGRMLDDGASTFYEVEDTSMFGGSSLSHGWSAVPVYILRKYGMDSEQ